jgi:pyruvate dehydrogenase E1 component beta subunit
MRNRKFGDAIEQALAEAMAKDPNIIILGEDVHTLRRNLFVRFGQKRVRHTPISESAFLGAAVGAAMAGLRPVAELIMVDFVAVCVDALLNHAAKLDVFSGGRWQCPLVVRMACGGGYGDGGQHEQSLWGWLAHIPGMSVVVPSTPADAYGLMLSALEQDSPVIYMEHKLLADYWLEFLGSGGRKTVSFDVPGEGAAGPIPRGTGSVPIGEAVIRRSGTDLTIVSLGVGVHRSLEAAELLESKGISAEVIDLRTVTPLDKDLVCGAVSKTRRLLCVDEDYEQFGLSGELAAIVLEKGLSPSYARVCTRTTIPYARHLEDETLPNVQRIVETASRLVSAPGSQGAND